MTSPDWSSLLHLYQRILCRGVLQYLQQQAGVKTKRGVYQAPVVLWLMMLQRLRGRGTLASAVQLLMQGAADPLLVDCCRTRQRRFSCRTGGYSHARQKLPKLFCKQVSQEILEQLRQVLSASQPLRHQNVFIVDGSSLELEHEAQLLQRYPPASNQHGRGHWPVLRLVVMHDAATGLAQPPYWGPMFGPNARSEQDLATQAMEALPAAAVILGDRNFGIFSIAFAAQQRGLGMVLRLTDVRARKLAGPICQPGDYGVTWRPSRWDGGKDHSWPAEAEVPGRLIATRVGRGKSQQWLYLFTTLPGSEEEILEIYGLRWNIETDLRSLKRTVQLHHIRAKSEDMMEKEILMAVSAYNLVRAVMCMAARRSAIDPRQLSFSQVLNVVEAAWPKLLSATSKQQHDQEFMKMLDLAAQCSLPKRKKRRSYPRRLWRRPPGFGFRVEKTK